MNSHNKILLIIDGIVNIILGILLLLFPFGIAEYLGVPKSDNYFYPTILGGVILGIGVALLFERYGYANNFRGLGLGGAIIINIVGSSVLLSWLIFANCLLRESIRPPTISLSWLSSLSFSLVTTILFSCVLISS